MVRVKGAVQIRHRPGLPAEAAAVVGGGQGEAGNVQLHGVFHGRGGEIPDAGIVRPDVGFRVDHDEAAFLNSGADGVQKGTHGFYVGGKGQSA